MGHQEGSTLVRDDGDACPRELCGGKIAQRNDGLMECNQCHFTFNKSFRVGEGNEGAPPVIVPDEIVTAYAKAHHALMMEIAEEITPEGGGPIDPEKTWREMTPQNRQRHFEEGKRVLEKCWTQIALHFRGAVGDVPGVAVATAQAAEELRALLTEIAIPSLKYCEDKFGHDNMARVNLEAGLGLEVQP